jgi:hypothetical protein
MEFNCLYVIHNDNEMWVTLWKPLVAAVEEVIRKSPTQVVENTTLPDLGAAGIRRIIAGVETAPADGALLSASLTSHFDVVPLSDDPLHDIRYIHIHEREDVCAVGIFVIPPGGSVRLHDHPYMTVVARLLYGSLTITELTWVDEDMMLAVKSTRLVKAPDFVHSCPAADTIHGVVTSDGCAILEVLVPPYGGGERDISFYEVIEQCGDDIVRLAATATGSAEERVVNGVVVV